MTRSPKPEAARVLLCSGVLTGVLAMVTDGSAEGERRPCSDEAPAVAATTYELSLVVDYGAKTIAASCMLTATNWSHDLVGYVPIVLHPSLTVEAITDEKGRPLPFTQGVVPSKGHATKTVNYVDIRLPRPVQPGQSASVSLHYGGLLSGYADEGMLYLKDHVGDDFTIIRTDALGYPQISYATETSQRRSVMRHFGKGFDYSIEVTVPDNLVVANGGALVGTTRKDGLATYVYKNIKPAWRMDICIADYEVHEGKTAGLRVFYFRNHERGASRVYEAAEGSIRLFTDWFGPLDDWRGFAVIEVPEGYGSQADVTCVLQTADAFTGELHELYHEISHFWNPRPLDDAPSRFETEGLACFLEYLVAEKLENRPGLLDKGVEAKRNEFRMRCGQNGKFKTVAMCDYGKAGLTDGSYSKGMVALYVLYRLVGEDGLLQIIREFRGRHATKGATLADFVDVAEEVSSRNLTKFFEDWVYGAKSSEYVVNETPVADIVARYD